VQTNLYDEYRAALALLAAYVHDHTLDGDMLFGRQLAVCYDLKSRLLAYEAAQPFGWAASAASRSRAASRAPSSSR
jgi:hypothetical protein